MTDTLRDRIAAVLYGNLRRQQRIDRPDRFLDWIDTSELADAVIRELGWREETQTIGDGMGGVSINSKTGERTFHHRAATRQFRYVTEWMSLTDDTTGDVNHD